MFKKILLFLLVGVISYTSFLIATLPASFVWNYISPQLPLKLLQLNVNGVSGTVWKGSAYIDSRGIEGVLGWDISLLGLFSAQLPVKLEMKTNLGQLDTTARLFANGIELSDTKGRINLSPLNPLLKAQRISLSGQLNIDRLSIGMFDRVITTANGYFRWTGGRVEYPAGREVHGNEFPSFTGELNQKAGTTSLLIKDSESSINAIEGVMDGAGVVTLKIRRRLLDLANEPWPQNSTENDVVFKVKRKVSF